MKSINKHIFLNSTFFQIWGNLWFYYNETPPKIYSSWKLVPRIQTIFLPSIHVFPHWFLVWKHLSFELKNCCPAGGLYLPVLGRCVRCGGDSTSAGMTMENLIITVIFIPGKYSCGSLGLNLSVAPSPEQRGLSSETGMAFRSCAFTVKLLRYSGL